MLKSRLESFSDAVIAIIITIMVLEMKVPHGVDLAHLALLWPIFLSYALSFVKIGIYWKNHHGLLHTIEQIDTGIVWSNLFWLFWLSLLPFTTGWMGENSFAPVTVAVYSLNLLVCAGSYGVLRTQIMRQQEKEHKLEHDIRLSKGGITVVAYMVSTPVAFLGYPFISGVIIVAVAIMWLVPDRRIENRVRRDM